MSFLKIKLDTPQCEPYKKHHYDAGFDLKDKNGTTIRPYEEKHIHTGVYAEIPEGYVGLVFPRSSMGKNGLVLLNTVGVIDSHYRGEIIVMAKNINSNNKLLIDQYERFAQLVIVPVFLPTIEIVEKLSSTERGTGGFGSTGK